MTHGSSKLDSRMMHALPDVTRRAALSGLGASFVLGKASISLGASTANNRLVVINVRGGMDGLSAVIPYGDPALPGLRAALTPSNMVKVDGFFALHPSLANFYAMMRANQAMAIHAVGPTVAVRSHFAAQDYMQMGSSSTLSNGWLNRALTLNGTSGSGLAMSAEVPIVLRGSTLMPGWAPDRYQQTSMSLASTMVSIGGHDAALGPAETLGFANRAAWNPILGTASSTASDLVSLAQVAGALLGSSTGPRVAVLQTDNFDTHDDQNAVLSDRLSTLDTALLTLKTSLGSAWANTVVLTMTEFGRTAYANGTNGSDHGTGFAVLVAGGAVQGGRVVATWPGLSSSQLYQNRDLSPTVDFRAIAMGLLISHLGMSASSQQTIFPGSVGVVPMTNLTTS